MTSFSQRVLLVPLAVAALAGALLGGCSREISEKDIEPISLVELRTLTEGKHADSVLLVDPRAPSDYEAGHLPGAKNYQLNDERAKTGGGLNPVFKGHRAIVVYGNDPGSAPARAMTMRLMSANADHVRYYSGGLIEWRQAGLRVEKNATAAPGDPTKKTDTLAK